jgi:acetoin utilization deacetylase AcuC-like enzyme
VQLFYCDDFVLPLPPQHRFPMRKYTQLRARILSEQAATEADMRVPGAVTDAQILRCHTPDYVHRAKHGLLTLQEVRRIGFPWSPELIERSRHSSGGTVAACLAALTDGAAVNLAGGTHHACPDHGEGFCVFNDAAIAARIMQHEHGLGTVLVIDLDVHQGNGTAAITQDDPTIVTLSIHGEKNYPFRKIPGDIDIGLPNDTSDDLYLQTLADVLPVALAQAQPELAIFIAGADPFVGDRLGKLALTKAGLAVRDQMVFDLCHAARVPVAVAMGGGYAPDLTDIVDIHLQTVRVAAAMASAWAAHRDT